MAENFNVEVSLVDNSDLFKNALDEQIEQALIAIGMTAETYAKKELTDSGAVDTGRLRNSVTFALAGEEANIKEYKDDNENTYTYSGTAPSDKKGERSVFIGTNVEYADFIEAGTKRMKSRPYLRPAAANHTDEYKGLVKQALSR